MKRLILALVLLSSPAVAVDYTQPPGAPQIVVPNYGVTVSVFAAATGVGQGIGVFELRSTGWYLCGQCLASPQFPTMDAAVTAAGGPGPYIETVRPQINSILASRYPAIGPQPPTTAMGAVNQALGSYTIRMVNGVPVVAP